jgi:shikimate 5-dehydrogenase
MLIRQALGQYHRWTGRDAPEHLMYRACLDRLGATRME